MEPFEPASVIWSIALLLEQRSLTKHPASSKSIFEARSEPKPKPKSTTQSSTPTLNPTPIRYLVVIRCRSLTKRMQASGPQSRKTTWTTFLIEVLSSTPMTWPPTTSPGK